VLNKLQTLLSTFSSVFCIRSEPRYAQLVKIPDCRLDNGDSIRQKFSLYFCFTQTISGAHHASCPTNTIISSPRLKITELEIDYTLLASVEMWNV
jgi:hypothetical protein